MGRHSSLPDSGVTIKITAVLLTLLLAILVGFFLGA
jgi:hypothetical protein